MRKLLYLTLLLPFTFGLILPSAPDHGVLPGLLDNDHTQYILDSGDTTGAMTSDLNLDDNTLVISYDDNNVGIGTATPDGILDIESTTTAEVFIKGGEAANVNLYLYADQADDNADKWMIQSNVDNTFRIRNYSTGAWVDYFIIDNVGNISMRMPKAIYAELSDSTDQTFGSTGTAQSITFNTNDELVDVTHSTSVNPENITIDIGGVYYFIAQPQIHAGAGGAGYFHMWLQKDTGGGFADIVNSNIEITLVSNDERVGVLAETISLDVDDTIRLRASVGDTKIELDAQAPGGEPAIPSIIFTMFMVES